MSICIGRAQGQMPRGPHWEVLLITFTWMMLAQLQKRAPVTDIFNELGESIKTAYLPTSPQGRELNHCEALEVEEVI